MFPDGIKIHPIKRILCPAPNIQNGVAMKGFMHVIEIVIISLLVIVVIGQLFRSFPSQSAWDRTQLNALSEDILHSMKAAGVQWTDTSSVEGQLSLLLGGTSIIYDLEIQNLPRPSLWVGCLCTTTEYDEFRNMLTTTTRQWFMLNAMNYSISLERLDPENPDFPLVYDAIIIGAKPDFLEGSQNLMQKYLATGRGIVEIRHLDAAKIDNDAAQQTVFGLEHDFVPISGDPGAPTSKVAFNAAPESRYYNVRKYFLAIPNVSSEPDSLDDFINSSFVFSNFLKQDPVNPERVLPDDGNLERILLEVTGTTPHSPALIVRDKVVKGFGRTAWVSAGYQTGEAEEKAILMKALLLWVSGETLHVTGHEIKNPETAYLIDVIERERYLNPSMNQQLNQKTTFFHPLKIVLSLGYALK